ncbi:MAG: hypothetical protein CR980_00520 [Propionibacteriales bacterium]|nr:MAG: hypothetical protein CR980_00520 [Propionibacteriales bacterium]
MLTGVTLCCKTGCNERAVGSLTFAYSEATAVVGPLPQEPDPSSYPLCASHVERFSVPQGWEVIRLPFDQPAEPGDSDIMALADAIREAGFTYDDPRPVAPERAGVVEVNRRGHLSVWTDPDRN